jgi:hypothetical protein
MELDRKTTNEALREKIQALTEPELVVADDLKVMTF